MDKQHHTEATLHQLPLALSGEDPGRPVPAWLHTDALRADLGPLACYVQTLVALPAGFVARLRLDTPRADAELIYAEFDRHAARVKTIVAPAAAPAAKTRKPRPRKAAPAQPKEAT
ncbi:hypothetical protein [Candidatus Thiodictyon syntrophicum]|jgi:hypothetical protein|uniref:Uncharacterized protein n=1 Tax=Candidatus Thiodictyon syntrophicum TaxID=1166950 RepID=A0A2K8UDX0_9GAMM|nr:hypothetical protein [Candidatus Thiodictyon syntrophicum]AUB83762.1 hypothetical protein THSYN_24270 [Candidatus Thiodictyon syntrophicum]